MIDAVSMHMALGAVRSEFVNNRCDGVEVSSVPGLALCGASLPATPDEMVALLTQAQNIIPTDVELPTEHVIHSGMYARTVRMPQGTILIGALIRRATMLVVNGHSLVFVGDGWSKLSGYNVIPASAGRKQMFYSLSPVEITMLFPTQAKTVAEAEREFTDEHEQLLSNHQDCSKVIITGE